MKVLPVLALLLTIAAWVLTVTTGQALLSGPFEGRTCQTECVKSLFFSGVGVTIGALAFTLLALMRSTARAFSYAILALAAPVAAVYTTITVAGLLS
ncbi:hypothetical protein [Thiococcus pfennigii]|uniref:hypothetical protein n=1 Tax=Thiococcus pfennigii TaxID=1057 RepID=UPI001903250D|nr:hypothetical protein [Thiococcus pfennigii]